MLSRATEMNSSKQKLGEFIQLIAMFAAMMSIWGWLFWLSTLNSDMTLDRWRADPELDSVIALADALSYLAPVALIAGVVALLWRPRYVGFGAIVLGTVGTCWLVFGV